MGSARRTIAASAIIVAFAGVGAVGAENARSPEKANLWVKNGAGPCTRSATRVTYAGSASPDARCGSFEGAYRAANRSAAASTVVVKGGQYGPQTITGNRTSSNRIVFDVASGETVTTGQIRFGFTTGNVYDANPVLGPDYVTLRNVRTGVSGGGPNRFGIVGLAGSSNITLDSVRAGSSDWYAIAGPPVVNSANNLVVRNSRFGPCWSDGGGGGCGNNKIEAATNALIKNNVYFDYLSSGHWECMFLNGGRNITLRGNVFRRCAGSAGLFTEDIGRVGYQNLLIENNVFGPALGGDLRTYNQYALAIGCKATHIGYSTLTIRNNSFARNARIDLGSFSLCNSVSNMKITGNILPRQDCAFRTTYSYNVYNDGLGRRRGGCGRRDVNIGGNTFPFYADDTLAPFRSSYRLSGARAAPDNRVPIALCPRTDFKGKPRRGPFCDAGAFER
jgi:hypothetical protein